MRLQRLISTRLASSGRDTTDMAEAGRIVFCWHFCWHSRVEEFQILAALAVRFGGGGRNRLSIPAVALRICLILLAIQALPALSDPIIFNRFGVRFGVRSRTLAGGGVSSTGGGKTGRRQRVPTLAFFRILCPAQGAERQVDDSGFQRWLSSASLSNLSRFCRCHENITAAPKPGGLW